MAIFHLLTMFDYALMAVLCGVFILAAINSIGHH
jgi:hypothetical protein